jgi:hypothetical protein
MLASRARRARDGTALFTCAYNAIARFPSPKTTNELTTGDLISL